MLKHETPSLEMGDDVTPEMIVRDLKSQDLATQMRAVRAACNILCKKKSSATAMVEASICSPLVQALDNDDCPELQYRALDVLNYIAFGAGDHTVTVLNSGVIPKLVTFLAYEQENLVERAIFSLGNFAFYGPESTDAVLAHGAVPAMLPYLQLDTPIVQLRTFVRVYSNLCSHDDDNRAHLDQISPALPNIYEILDIKVEEPIDIENGKYTDNKDNSESQQQHLHNKCITYDIIVDACTALVTIMHGPDKCIQAVQDVVGLTARLVDLLGHEATSVQEAALSAVGNMLAGTDAQVDRCLDVNCLEHIVSLLQCSEPSLVQEAARAAGNILAGTHAQIQLALDLDILTALRNILASAHPECRKQAMHAVTQLCYNGSAAQRDRLVSSDVMVQYCALLAGPDRAIVVEVLDSLDLLLQAAERDGNVKPLCYELDNLGVLDQIQELQDHFNDENDNCKIGNMCVSLRKHAREERFFIHGDMEFTAETIVQDLKSRDMAMRMRATEAVCYMLREQSPPLYAMVEANILTPLVAAMEADAGINHLYAAALEHSLVTTGTRIRRTSVAASIRAVPKLLVLIVQLEENVAELSACYLVELGLHGPVTRDRQVSQEPEKLKPILRKLPFVSEVLNYEDPEILELACDALAKLINTDHNSIEAVQAMPGFMARFLDLLAHETPNVSEKALKALYYMLCGTEAQVDRCVEAGCLDHVISFLQSSQPYMVELAAGAVVEIFSHKHLHIQQALEKGVLTALRNILAHGEPECQKQAAIALVKLCVHGSAAQLYQLEQSGILEPLCALLTGPDLTVTKCGLNVVYALLQTAEKQRKQRKDNDIEKLLCTKLDKIGVIEQLQLVMQEQSIDEDLRNKAVLVSISLRTHSREEYVSYSYEMTLFTLEEIVRDLKSQDLDTQRTAASAAHCFLCTDDAPTTGASSACRTAAVQAGIVAPLVEALGRDDDPVLQKIAIYAIMSIVYGTHKHRVALVNGGAIPKLVTLLSKAKAIAKLAAVILGWIVHNAPETRDQVLANGAVQAMLPLMRPDTPLELLRACVQAYMCWCSIPIVSESMFNIMLPALPYICELLDSGDPDVLTNACVAVGNLICKDDRIEPIQAVPGLTERLVALLGHEVSVVKEAAMSAIANTCSGTDLQVNRCLDAGCLEYIVLMLQYCKQPEAIHAARAAQNISHPYHIQRALDKGILTPLLNALSDSEPNSFLELRAVSALANIAMSETREHILVLADEGTISKLVRILSHEAAVVERAAAALGHIVQEIPETGDLVLGLGAVEAMLPHMLPDTPLDVLQTSTWTYKCLCMANVSVPKMSMINLVLPALPFIAKLLDIGDIKVLLNILEALYGLMYDSYERTKAVQATPGLTARVVSLLGHHNTDVKKAALVTITRFLNADCLDHILSHLQSNEPPLVEFAVSATSEILIRLPSQIERVLKKGMLPPLLHILADAEPKYFSKHRTIDVFVYISEHGTREQRMAIVQSGAIPKLIAILSRGPEEAQKVNYILVNIAWESPEACEVMLEHGVVSAMLPCMQAGTPSDLLTKCLTTIGIICRHDDMKSSDKLQRVSPALPTISELLNIGDAKVVITACFAVFELTKTNEGIEAIQSVPELTGRLLALGGHDATAVKIFFMKALINMLSGTDAQIARCLDADCLDHILSLLQSNEPSVVENAVWATCKLLIRLPSQIERVLKDILSPLLHILAEAKPKSLPRQYSITVYIYISKHGTREQIMAIVQSGAIPMLIALLSHGPEEAVNPIYILINIARELPETCEVMLKHGLVSAMLPFMHADTPSYLLTNCVMAFRIICSHDDTKPSDKLQRVSPALPTISELLNIGDEEVVTRVCFSLVDLMKTNEGIEAVQAVPGLTARLLALVGHEATVVKNVTMKALMLMLSGTDAQIARCLDAGCLDHILSLLQSNEPSVVENAVWATCKLLIRLPSQIERVLKDILSPLLHILADAEPKSLPRQYSITVYIYISKHGTREQIMAIVQSGAIPMLIALLSHGPEEAVNPIYILINIACELPETCEVMLEYGLVSAMLPFMHADTPSYLLTKCVMAFRIICRHDDTKPSDKLQRVSPALPTISELLNIGDEEVVTRVCFSLVDLMKTNEGIEAVQAVPGLTARFLALVGHDATVVKNVTMKALMLMLSGTDAQVDHCLDANCVDHMTTYLQCRDPFLMEQAAEVTRSTLGTTHPQLQRALDKDVLTPFMRILGYQPKDQKTAVKAITNLCRRGSAAQREQLVSSCVLEPYCALLAGPDRTVVVEVLDSLDVLLQVALNDNKLMPFNMKLVDIGILNQIKKAAE